jgi:hypothetical protein
MNYEIDLCVDYAHICTWCENVSRLIVKQVEIQIAKSAKQLILQKRMQ